MKKLLIIFLLILAVFTFSGCAGTPEQANELNELSPEEIAAYNADPKNTDKIVCEKIRSTGTRVPQRVCLRQSTIDARNREAQEEMTRVQSGSKHIKID